VLKNMQSDQWSFPLITKMAKDNSRIYSRLFDHIFDFCDKVRDQGVTSSDGRQLNAFLIPDPKDMKSHQIFLGRGGASKGPGIVHFCHLCMCTSDKIALPNQMQCVKRKYKGKVVCRHHDMCYAEDIANCKEELATLEQLPLAAKPIHICWDTPPIEAFDDANQYSVRIG
jgi:hypothetical protein